MQVISIKATIAVLWIFAVCTAGIAGNLSSLSSWIVLAGVAVLPTLVMMRWWSAPHQTMSQTIQKALR